MTTPTQEAFLIAMATYAKQQTPELTDFQPGSIYRSLLEGLSAELEMLGYDATVQTQNAISESAYRVFSFDRRPAQAASGVLTFTTTAISASAVTFPKGSLVRVPGTDKVYATQTALTIAAGASGRSFSLTIVSIAAGTLYNAAATTIKELVTAVAGVAVSNPAAFVNGRDEETDDERRQRFSTFVRSMHRATAEALEYAAELATVKDVNGLVIESVYAAKVIDASQGHAFCYIYNGTTSAPSADLILAVEEQVANYKAAGVTVDVAGATLRPVSITIDVLLSATSSLSLVETPINDAIQSLIADLGIGDVLYVQQLEQAVLSIPGVIDMTTTLPTTNEDPGESGQVVIDGAIVLGEL